MSESTKVSYEGQLQQIAHYLDQPSINYEGIGKITNEGFFDRYVRAIWLHNDKPRLVTLIKYVNQAYEAAEQKGIKVFNDHVASQQVQAEAEAYRRRFEIYFKVTGKIGEIVKQYNCGQEPAFKKELENLRLAEMALRYNLGASLGGYDPLPKPDSACLAELVQMTAEWKKKQPHCQKHEVNELEQGELEVAACHPLWVELLKQNPANFDEFMKWSIRDYNPAEVFIKYFATQKRIKAALLAPYLGYSRDRAEETLAIKVEGTKTSGIMKKVLYLPIYDGSLKEFNPDKKKWVSILKPDNLIHFEKGNYWITVDELFNESAKKDLTEVNVNLCANWGFVNFHPAYGQWNADTRSYEEMPSKSPLWTGDNWMEKAPPMRVASKEEIEKIYGDKVKDKKFFYQVRGTRSDQNLKALGCHGFFSLYVAMGDGNWKVLNVGVYAYRFQQNIWEAIQMFCGTMKRVLALQDQNGVYTFRQKAAMTFFPSAEKAKEFTDKLYNRLLRTEGVFQLAAINCAFQVQKNVNAILDKPINFYKMRMSQATSGIGFVDAILRYSDRCHDKVRDIIIWLFHRSLFSHRTETVDRPKGPKTYSTCKFINEQGSILHNPSYFLHQIQKAQKTHEKPFADGRLFWGNTEERIQPPHK